MDTIYFPRQSDLRKWFQKNHDKADELWAGYYKRHTGKPSITWKESVDEALCFGWIDGLRKSIDEERYKIRFTPRRKSSIWSTVNITRIKQLIKLGLVKMPGLKAFQQRDEKKSRLYSFEQQKVKLSRAYENEIKSNSRAWNYFHKLPPSVKKLTIWYVMSAKKEETQKKRLGILIRCSEEERRIPELVITKKNKYE